MGSGSSGWDFLQKPVSLPVDGLTWAYGNDLNDSLGCNSVNDPEVTHPKTVEPSQFVLKRFARTGFRYDDLQGGSHLPLDFGMQRTEEIRRLISNPQSVFHGLFPFQSRSSSSV
jgi:hypothetical protein